MNPDNELEKTGKNRSPNWGGRRARAGRRPASRAVLAVCPFRLLPDSIFLLREIATARKVSPAIALSEILDAIKK